MKRAPLLGASIGAWIALATIGPAEADCVTSCLAGKGCGLQNESHCVQPGYCSIAQSDCEVQGRNGEGSGSKCGAIALSASTNAWGDAYRDGGRAEVERHAIADCGKNARHWAVAVWFNDAIADCRKRGREKCELQHAVCPR
jgi:hypothetical protein